MSSGFMHKHPTAIIDSEAGQLEALALAAKFVGTLGSLLTDKDGIKNVNAALADFDKKHAEHKAVMASNREILTQIENDQAFLEARAKEIEVVHIANMGEVEVAHQQKKDQFEAEMKTAAEGANLWLASEKRKLTDHSADLEAREQDLDQRSKDLDQREADLLRLHDSLAANSKAQNAREEKLNAHAKKLDARHDEVTALEKNALKG